MGKLTISGSAKKECSCDVMYITLTFKTWERDTAKGLAQTKSQCDEFLHILEQNGIHVDKIHISDDSISQSMQNNILLVNATRKIEFRLSFNMVFLNRLSEIIKENSYTVDMKTSFELSNKEELHQQLIKDAVLDSRKKAEIIAHAMNQNIVGIKTLHTYSKNTYDDDAYYDIMSIFSKKSSISDRLSAPLCTETESVEVEWIIK